MANQANASDQSILADLLPDVEQLIGQSTQSDAKVLSTETVSGGCINSAICCCLENGKRYFVKFNRSVPDVFGLESEGLEAIRSTGAFKVPEVIGFGKTELETQFLVLEFIPPAPKAKNFFEVFGRQLAQMHQANHEQSRFGFASDNFIGSTPQKNAWHKDWVEFFAVQRLEFQLKLANDNGWATPELNKRCDKLILQLDRFIGSSSEPPALLHGDLWSGNYLISSQGNPVLIDPAVYFGARESEFGMIKLFGGFNSEFYHAYNEAYPLADGWQQRTDIYQLYHLLNHLNLFGTSYLSGCLQILRKLG